MSEASRVQVVWLALQDRAWKAWMLGLLAALACVHCDAAQPPSGSSPGPAKPALPESRSPADDTSATNVPASSKVILSAEQTTATVARCAPCWLQVDTASHRIEFQPQPGDKTLTLHWQPPAGKTRGFDLAIEPEADLEYLLMALDVDFDQSLDFALVPQRYTPNAATELFVLEEGVPRHLGQFMSPRLDAKARQITTREKGGHAGMLFKEQTYGWQQGELRLLREVEQVVGEKAGTYERITRSYADEKAPSEKRETVAEPADP